LNALENLLDYIRTSKMSSLLSLDLFLQQHT